MSLSRLMGPDPPMPKRWGSASHAQASARVGVWGSPIGARQSLSRRFFSTALSLNAADPAHFGHSDKNDRRINGRKR